MINQWVYSKRKVLFKVKFKKKYKFISTKIKFVIILETKSNLPPLSSAEVTTVDANRIRRETKTSPLQKNDDNLKNDSKLNDQSNAKNSNIQDQTRESGDGASSAGPDAIENLNATVSQSNDGRRVLSTARNGSLFDDDDDDVDGIDNDSTAVNATNSINAIETTSSSIEKNVISTTIVE